MAEKSVFEGRTLAVIDDFSLDERLYLFEQTRILKKAWQENNKDVINSFRIGNRDFGLYEAFIEKSTRTQESFKNASKFHRVKFLQFNADKSSFGDEGKSESYSDTFNTLIGYDNRIFVVRTKLEGVCRALEFSGARYAERHGMPKPSFINAGDGRHEHPTQEILDDFSFLEDNNWNHSSIHIALIVICCLVGLYILRLTA